MTCKLALTYDEISLVRRSAESINGDNFSSGWDVGELKVLHLWTGSFPVTLLKNGYSSLKIINFYAISYIVWKC
jgi:hypothetical protein